HAVGQITCKFNDQSHRLPPEQSIISSKSNKRQPQALGDKTGNYWTIVHTIFFYARHHNSTLLALISPVITKI
ncbi:hypothetical protein, partial [Klebsiella pneumoniae]